MNIGIIGSGHIGATAARLFVGAGHPVAIGNSRGPESLQGLIGELGPGAQAVTAAGAAEFGELVLVAIPLGRYRELPLEALKGRIVIDAMNYYPGRDGELELGEHGSSGLLASSAPGARVVKAFNTMNSELLGRESSEDPERRLAIFLAGDDEAAKEAVSELIREVGFAPVDTGSLAEGGRRQSPGSPIYNKPMTEAEARAALEAL